jgi:FkbM family methyltransferase
MKILERDLRLRAFIPPVLVEPIERIGSFLKRIPYETKPSIQPFVSPVLGSHSQFNEDLLIDLLMISKKNGFYLDIGANDPSFNNNMKRFYDKGWSGINIEPGVDSIKKFSENRPLDINLNIGVGPFKGTLTFYQVVGDSTLSSFNKNIAKKMASKFGLAIEEIEIDVLRLTDVFEEYVKGRQVDFMSVDAEGLDLEILESNNWKKFRPTLVMIEIDNQYREIIEYMDHKNYRLIFNNYHNGIFIDNSTKDEHLSAMLKSSKVI